MIRNCIFFLVITLVSCGGQKELSGIADRIAKDYLAAKNIIIINEALNQSLLEAINNKYNYYKDYNSSPVYPTVGDTLKRIFSEKNAEFFKVQLNKQTKWAEKPYVKQTIINQRDRNKYRKETIFSLSYPVITQDKKYALMQSSFYNRHYMTGSNELLIFVNRKNKWILYKRLELFLH